MSHLYRVLSAVLVLVLAPGAFGAPPAEMADLFPAGTLAFAEVRDPGELAPQIAAIFKGSALEDSIPFIHNRKDSATTLAELTTKRGLAYLGLIASPEVLAEFKKLRIAAGVTSFTEQGEPEGALVILTQDSPAAGVAARAFLTMSPQVRKVGETSKIPVFQFRDPNINYDNNGTPTISKDRPFSDGPHEFTFAYTPGLFVIGTGKNAVAESIRRYLGEEKSPRLATVPAFKEAAAAHPKPGIFFYLKYNEFAAKFVRLTAFTREGHPGRSPNINRVLERAVRLGESDLIQYFNLTFNAKAISSLSGTIRLRDGGLAVFAVAAIDSAQKSPMLDLLSGPGVKLDLLHNARHPANLAVALTLPEKNRAAAIIGFLDGVAKANGVLGRLPSDFAKEFNEKFKLSIHDTLLNNLTAATVVLPAKQEIPKGGKPGPLLVLQATDLRAATAWEEILPKLIGDLGGSAVAPQTSTETIDDVKVFSVLGAGLPWNAPVHFARSGSTIAIGLDRKLVAAATTGVAAESVIGGDRAIAPPKEPVELLGVIFLGDALARLLETPHPKGPVVPAPGLTTFPNGQPIPEKLIQEALNARKKLLEALGTLPHATFSARRAGQQLHLELFQPKVLNGGLKTVIDATSNWLDRIESLQGGIPQSNSLELIK